MGIIMSNLFNSYLSTFGTVVTIDRPMLTGYRGGATPYSVYHQNGRSYREMLGITCESFEEIKPDVVIWKLADGSLLSASAQVVISSAIGYSRAFRQDCYTTAVNQMIPITELPEAISISGGIC